MGGGDESPLRSAGLDASALESSDAPVVLDLTEDRLDRVFSLAVEGASGLAGDDAAHEVVAWPFAVRAGAPFGVLPVGWHEWPHSSGSEALDLLAGPEAGVGEHNVDLFADPGRGQFPDGGVRDRLQQPVVVAVPDDLGSDDDLLAGRGSLRVIALDEPLLCLDRP